MMITLKGINVVAPRHIVTNQTPRNCLFRTTVSQTSCRIIPGHQKVGQLVSLIAPHPSPFPPFSPTLSFGVLNTGSVPSRPSSTSVLAFIFVAAWRQREKKEKEKKKSAKRQKQRSSKQTAHVARSERPGPGPRVRAEG